MSRPVNYTPSELASFAMVPETCDTLHKAIAEVTEIDKEKLRAELASYRIEMTNDLYYAVVASVTKQLHPKLAEVQERIMYQCTFPLRLALVRMIEEKNGAPAHERDANHYEYWISSHYKMLNTVLKLAAEKAAAGVK